MGELSGGAIIGVVAGVVGGILGVLVLAMFMKPGPCSECGTPPPKIRKAANRGQMLWGGWTCSGCGREVNRRGKSLKRNA
jgi:hypothetical protein